MHSFDPPETPSRDLPYADRTEAGRALGARLAAELSLDDPIVLALPRGGVPVGIEVARELDAPLDVCVVRKLGVPGHEELAMGAIASGGVRVLNEDVLATSQIDPEVIDRVAEDELRELRRREDRYRKGRGPLEIGGRSVVLVDDGLATGATMRAAARALQNRDVGHLVIAVPIGPPDTCRAMRELADEVVCLATPTPFMGVGRWYRNFPQTRDEEVTDLLDARVAEAAHG